jgi:hypothetical protein
MSIGRVKGKSVVFTTRLKLMLSLETRRKLRKHYKRLTRTINKLLGKQSKENDVSKLFPILNLEKGDWVRVRSWEEIEQTLDERNDYKNCGFMQGMMQYVGTKQRVFKPVRVFVDERDLRLKKVKGIVLLEGLVCEGDERFGQCDRACYYFWREEWLERIIEG